jgi:hypothetical protein
MIQLSLFKTSQTPGRRRPTIDETNAAAAKLILADPERYPGLPLQWARAFLFGGQLHHNSHNYSLAAHYRTDVSTLRNPSSALAPRLTFQQGFAPTRKQVKSA